MKTIQFVNLSDLVASSDFPQGYIPALAKAILDYNYLPPIIMFGSRLLTPDVVAALVYMKEQAYSAPQEVAVRGSDWLVEVEFIKTEFAFQKPDDPKPEPQRNPWKPRPNSKPFTYDEPDYPDRQVRVRFTDEAMLKIDEHLDQLTNKINKAMWGMD